MRTLKEYCIHPEPPCHRWTLATGVLASREPVRTYQKIEWLHRGLLAFSLLTVLAAVAGSHGLIW